MTTLWLARHANRQDFADPDWRASADRPHDPGLSDDGVEQAKRLARRTTDLGIDRILASPFLRAVETAHHAADALETPLFLEPGLGEWLNTDWFEEPPETRSASTLTERFPRTSPDHSTCRTPTYPESRHRALARLGATGQCLADRYEGETLLVVGHGITVQGVLHGLIGSDVPDPGCPLASLTKVSGAGDDWSIHLRNDTSHLENGARAAERLV
jgi:broad specificity phosphatase PhoE